MKVRKNQTQRKKVGGIINFKIYKFIFFLLIFSLLKPLDVESKTISIIRDVEIEFFIQKMINNFTDNDIENVSSVRPIIVVNKSMNAFVTGNNKIFIHSGLLENLDSFEELEGIIAHEIGHLKLGHVESRKIFSKKNSKLANIGIFAVIGLSMAGLNNNVEGFILANNDFLIKNQFKYSRHQEMEADIYSIRALNKQNKSSYGLINFFKKIRKYNFQIVTRNNYYNSHPSYANRLELINSLSKIKNDKLTKIVSYGKLNLDLDKLKIKLTAYSKNETKLKNLENSLESKNLTYYNAIKNYINNDIGQLLINISKLKVENPNNPFIFEMSGNINFYNNSNKKAVIDLKKSLEIFNDHNVKPPTLIKLSLAHAYIKLNTPKTSRYALNLLEEIMPLEYNSRKLWRLIGLSATKLKIKSISLLAQAEEELLKKRIKKAKYFANLALKDNKIRNLYKFRAIDILNIN